ncbi:Lysine exporter LysO [Acididesulfobacillus acetoxydans]|uniref:Lysine exporter LysO n=1 Tax=Acididesulfobacillus acetoxydans TaxID=1561005 RepID=A0A8S0W7G0_9FIRM|nr:lysine exporter LysO family protein [Acididesulfobacillus acetoxydans]CAA7600719.1 Lysine exporter LysO [Acididesulfobacillus acetoxydans]CEJ06172.1 Membrane protein of unknown function (DUF340) [Acididesulfobacillus acetoxydans]
MVPVLVFLLLGVLCGWKAWLPRRILYQSSRMVTLGVFFLLLTMGIRIGADRTILGRLGSYGFQAFLFAVSTVLASLVLVSGFERLSGRRWVHRSEAKVGGSQVLSEDMIEAAPPGGVKSPKETSQPVREAGGKKIRGECNRARENRPEPDAEAEKKPLRMIGLILAALAAGILVGLSHLVHGLEQYLTGLTDGALYFTLFSVGLDLGGSKELWREVRSLGWYVLLAPLGVAAASVGAGMLMGKLLGWTWREGGAVGAGFGWYSLSGVLITQLDSVALGTVAFLANVFRELLSILLLPLLARRMGVLSLVAPGGATTMDTTLPVIAAVGPPEVVVIALVNGITLSALVPVLVPLLLGK